MSGLESKTYWIISYLTRKNNVLHTSKFFLHWQKSSGYTWCSWVSIICYIEVNIRFLWYCYFVNELIGYFKFNFLSFDYIFLKITKTYDSSVSHFFSTYQKNILIKCIYLYKLVQDRAQWWAYVMTVMSFWF